MAEDPRKWLRDSKVVPGSYAELIQKLQDARELYAYSGKSELGRLVDVFTWCRDNGIELSDLKVTKNFAKYQTASAYLYQIVEGDDTDGSKVKTVREIIARIRDEDAKRRDVRDWARGVRGEEPPGHKFYLKDAKAKSLQVVLDDEQHALLITGPSITIRLIRTAIKRYVDWDLSLDDDLLSELQRAQQRDE